jgi:hypothetical protein
MAKEIFVGNGATWVVKGKGKGSAWGLDGFSELFEAKGANKSCTSGIIIQNAAVKYSDTVIPVVGTDDVRVLYTFGKNFGQISVTGLIFMGATDKEPAEYASKLLQKFNETSVSAQQTPSTVSGPGLGQNTKVYWISLDLPTADADKNTIQFALNGIIAPIANKGK